MQAHIYLYVKLILLSNEPSPLQTLGGVSKLNGTVILGRSKVVYNDFMS